MPTAPRSSHPPPPAYAELQVATNFSFLRGGSHADELMAQAKALGLAAVAVADRNTLAGVVRAHAAAKEVGMRLIVGARLDIEDAPSLLCLPTDRAAYGRLCRLLSAGQMRSVKGECRLTLAEVAAHAEGQILIALAPDDWDWRETVADATGVGRVEPFARPGIAHSTVIVGSRASPRPTPAELAARSSVKTEPAEIAAVAVVSPDSAEFISFATKPRATSEPQRFNENDRTPLASGEGLGVGRGHGEAHWDRTSIFSSTVHIPTLLPVASPHPQPLPAGEGSPRAAVAPDRPNRPTSAPPPPPTLAASIARLRAAVGSTPLYLAASYRYRGDDRAHIAGLARVAAAAGTPLVATNDILYHAAHRRPLQDVLTCIRLGCTIDAAGLAVAANAERHLKPPSEMARLFAGHEDAIARTLAIADRCRFSLDELRYEYPDEPVPPGQTPQGRLAELTEAGARWRYPDGVPAKVEAALAKELALIEQLGYAPYFLTVHDIVTFARARDILCQGRGSAANSAVCYCLGITAVNPTEVDLLFERFISPERREPPDIDVDFEHERREEVIQYIYARYGRDRAGLAATVISYRARSAVREVGKAMGLSADTIAALAGMVWGTRSGDALPEPHIREAGLDPADPLLSVVIELTRELIGFPRHLSQHVGGFVLTRGPLIEMVPVGNGAMADRTFIEWDKDDLATLGLMKVDVLALGMLTCIRKAFGLLKRHHGRPMTLASVPREDQATYDMLCRADSIGVFQVESRAQMNMLPRLKPRTFYDLVIEVAIVRPGPIQGDMVHPYLRRRDGVEAEDYPAPAPEHGDKDELRQILGKTKGVPLFQEQAMRIAMEAARFSAEEANQLRKAMATFRRKGTIGELEEKMVGRMVARGYAKDFAERCFNQIKGFGDYGFPESHAASFAHLVYVSAWLKCHYPAAFAAALLNSQPMGFYAPAQIVRCAQEHGVSVLPVDAGLSGWDATLEDRALALTRADRGQTHGSAPALPALRLGLRQIDGLREEESRRIVAAARADRGQTHGSDPTLRTLQQRVGISPSTLERLAAADAFRSLGLDRRQALWVVKGLGPAEALPLFRWGDARSDRGQTHGSDPMHEAAVTLPAMPLSEHVVVDYQTLRLSLKAHPMSFLRDRLRAERILACDDLRRLKDGAYAAVAGVILVRQRPGTAKGVVFMTLEDETGVANAVIWPRALERYRRVVMAARLILIRGRIQRHHDIIHLVAGRLEDRSDWLALLSERAGSMPVPIARADEVLRPEPGSARASEADTRRHPRNARIIPKSRDFH